MEIIKILNDYAQTPLEKYLNQYIVAKLDSAVCIEKIRNKDFIIEHLKPLNEFVIYTNALPFQNLYRIT